ncbi:MAG TPA: hypothetical protein DIW47_01755 [Bacteroidetes bacterium]|nr:hypothetical protein [Bacteroidota bacterium]
MFAFIKRHPILTLLGFLFGLFLFFVVLPRKVRIGYRPIIWKVLPAYRYSMSHSLAKKITAEQLSYDEVRQMIKGGLDHSEEDRHLSYFLRSNGIIGLNSDWLEIDFTDSTTRARVINID